MTLNKINQKKYVISESIRKCKTAWMGLHTDGNQIIEANAEAQKNVEALKL